ncbi:MAG: PstS family phosphate ABC transporter substrate-binding protein [Spirochaetes bacterium]|jgi:phosphate transport system substrate-binding protein|nr:PstS family phosphate ABC transporter substrate-binding protein [Spirochaetota bacterium]
MYRKTFLIAVILLSAAALLIGCSKGKKDRVIIKGSTTVLPITQKAAEEYRKINKVSITIEGSGSGNGIKALIDGSADIANSSRSMKDEEKKAASENGIKVKEIKAAYDMIVPVVNPANRVAGLTVAQLNAIYDGSISNWKEIGGADGAIVVISRDTSSGTYEVWHEKVMKKTDVRKDALLQASNGAIVSTVSENPRAIGYVGFGYVSPKIKALKVNGVQPTIENGKSGRFPLSRELYMYVNENKLSDNAKKFIDYILSKEGQKLVKEDGFIPL